MLAGRMRMAASSSAVPWYRSGGAPAPIAVYNVREGGSLAGSYVNVVNPGTFDAAPGVAPTWSGTTGWGWDGLTTYLTTGITPGAGYAMLIRFTNGVTGRTPIGSQGDGDDRFRLVPSDSGTRRFYVYGNSTIIVSGTVTSGVMGLTQTAGYLNGALDATYSATWSSSSARPIVIGAFNSKGTIANFWPGNIQYVAVWDTDTGHATWMPQVSAAVAAL